MRWTMGVIGVLAILSALLPWIQGGRGAFDLEVSGLARGGWPMIIVGTVYLVALIDTISWKTLVGASLIGLISVGLGFSDGLVVEGLPISYGLVLATIVVLVSLLVVWRVRSPQTV